MDAAAVAAAQAALDAHPVAPEPDADLDEVNKLEADLVAAEAAGNPAAARSIRKVLQDIVNAGPDAPSTVTAAPQPVVEPDPVVDEPAA
jgi:hypothetical protein